MAANIRPSGYTEYAPSAPLRGHVACYWSRVDQGGDAPVIHRILPDGAVDIVIALARSTRVHGAAGDSRDVESYVVGTMTRALVFARTPRTAMFGVRLRAGAASSVLSVPASEFTDQRVDLTDVWRDAERFTAPVYRRALTGDDGVGAPSIVRELDRALAARVARLGAIDRTVAAAVSHIVGSGGAVSVAGLSGALGITRQHLARRFAEHVGVRPKLFARIVRLQQALARIARPSNVSWSALALDAGYYDQPHLVSDFRELTGLTPTEFVRER